MQGESSLIAPLSFLLRGAPLKLLFAGEEGPSGEGAQEQVADEMDGIDPEFIAALPPDLQAEVLEQQRRDRRLRDAAARRVQAQRQVGLFLLGISYWSRPDYQALVLYLSLKFMQYKFHCDCETHSSVHALVVQTA